MERANESLSMILSAADKTYVLANLVVELIDILQKGGTLRAIDIARATSLPKLTLRRLVGELSSCVKVERDRYSLTSEGENLASELFSYRQKRSEEVEERADQGLALLEQIEREREPSKRNLDQFRVTPATSIARAKLADEKFDIVGRRIVFLGDNDLTSVAAAVLGGSLRVTVLDIDSDVLETVARTAKLRDLNIECVSYDAREPLKSNLRGRFDILFTDPPYTQNGVRLFLSRAAGLLNEAPGTSYFSYGFSLRARERGLAIQRLIAEQGWLVYGMWPGFNQYYAAGSIGARSDLYRLIRTPKTINLVPGRFLDNIYTDLDLSQPRIK